MLYYNIKLHILLLKIVEQHEISNKDRKSECFVFIRVSVSKATLPKSVKFARYIRAACIGILTVLLSSNFLY